MIFKKMTAPNGHWPCNQENFAGTFDKDYDLIMPLRVGCKATIAATL